MSRSKTQSWMGGLAVVVMWLACTTPASAVLPLFVIDAQAGSISQAGSDNSVVDLVDAFITADVSGGFGGLDGLEGYDGTLSYLGVPGAVEFSLSNFGTELTITVPSTNTTVELRGLTPEDLADNFDDWLKSSGLGVWTDFLREMNGATPLAMLSGNPKSTVALMGDNAYRKFGFDDSRSRMGFGETIDRWGNFELRVDAGISTVKTDQFSGDMWAFDPSLTFAGDFGRHVGLSFSLIGQYRNYQGAKLADIGAELALPITIKRPDEGPWYWQITPFVQAAGGVSVDFAAGGLFMGGGAVNALGWNRGRYELLMSNEIAYYGAPKGILLAGTSDAGDEVWVVTENSYLINMSKDTDELGAEPSGELVGISRISAELSLVLREYAEQEAYPDMLSMAYETGALVHAGRHMPIRCPLVPDLIWSEIDDASQLEHARSKIYPQLA